MKPTTRSHQVTGHVSNISPHSCLSLGKIGPRHNQAYHTGLQTLGGRGRRGKKQRGRDMDVECVCRDEEKTEREGGGEIGWSKGTFPFSSPFSSTRAYPDPAVRISGSQTARLLILHNHIHHQLCSLESPDTTGCLCAHGHVCVCVCAWRCICG